MTELLQIEEWIGLNKVFALLLTKEASPNAASGELLRRLRTGAVRARFRPFYSPSHHGDREPSTEDVLPSFWRQPGVGFSHPRIGRDQIDRMKLKVMHPTDKPASGPSIIVAPARGDFFLAKEDAVRVGWIVNEAPIEQLSAAPVGAAKGTKSQLPDVEMALRSLFPHGTPTPNRPAIRKAVEKQLGRNVSPRTIDRARNRIWPRRSPIKHSQT